MKTEKRAICDGKCLAHNYWRKTFDLYYMLIPGLLLMVVFRFLPLHGMLIAFQDYDLTKGIWKSKWVGLDWFKVLFSSPDFPRLLRNTLLINFLEIIFVFFGSVVLAILINELGNRRYKKLVQTVSYLPYFLSWVVVGGLVIQLLSPSNTFIKWVFFVFGKEPTNLLLKQNWFYSIVTAGELWKSIGWNTILFLASMSGVSPELYEACKIDGGGKLGQIIHITLPGIRFIIVVTLLMKVGAMMNVGFEKIFVLQNNLILETSEVFSTWNYKVGIGQWNMSLSTTLSFFEAIVNFALVFTFDRLAKLTGEEGLF